MDNIKEMAARLAPKMNLSGVNDKRKLCREFVVQEPLKKEMPRKCSIDNETLSRALERIHKREEDIKKESREKMFKKFRKVAFWGGIIFVGVVLGVGLSKLSERSKKDEPDKKWEVDPVYLTSADIENMEGPEEEIVVDKYTYEDLLHSLRNIHGDDEPEIEAALKTEDAYQLWLEGIHETDTSENREWFFCPMDQRAQWLEDHPDF